MTRAAFGGKSGGVSGPYQHVAVASTFSPRFFAVLAEADAVARRLGSSLQVIHAAAEHTEAIERFFEALERLGRAGDTGILWSVAATPTEAIVTACERNGVDLLLAGALEREGDHRNFVGGVARDLLDRSNCDLLLLPEPMEAPRPCRRVVVDVDLKNPSVPFLNHACAVATGLGAEEMIFSATVTPFDEARAGAGVLDEARLADCVDPAEGFEGEVEIRLLRSTTGFVTCDFLQDEAADLFIAGRARRVQGGGLPPRLDWLRQVIPTDVLLVGV